MEKTPWDDHRHSPPAGVKIFPISKAADRLKQSRDFTHFQGAKNEGYWVMDENIKVILADDHQNVLRSISNLLSNSPIIEVVETAENGLTALELTQSVEPHVLVLDIDMPKLNGLQVSAQIQALEVDVKIVILSNYDDPSIVRAAFKVGARGYVLKNYAVADLIPAIKMVNEGEIFLSAPLAGYV
jgi:DNA-binding NarL/FixJ family response regulator